MATDDPGNDAAQASVFQPGDTVDHFRVMRLLGRGGMGEVYLARDTKLGRRVALKVVHRKLLGTKEALDRFFLEARATARFNHPHIITVFAVGEHGGSPYLALEYLAGQNLRQRMVQEHPGVRETLRIGLAIASALEDAHGHGIFHRDLKPENVLIPKDGRLRVLDFGLAKVQKGAEAMLAESFADEPQALVSTMSELGVSLGEGLKGTPQYMAPEQWRSEEATSATDVWALGVILYELLTGKKPYFAGTLVKLAIRACEAEVPPPASLSDKIPAKISELVSGCLQKEAHKRPSLARISEVLGGGLSADRTHTPRSKTPFLGLMPFSESHADIFFGREDEITAFLERLRVEPVMPVVGPSGAGKSSFVHAGIIPRLREQGPWQVLSLRPGRRPFQTLAGCLLGGESDTLRQSSATAQEGFLDTLAAGAPGAGAPAEEQLERTEAKDLLARQLEQAPNTLALKLQQAADQEDTKILLFVDQLEEVYTLTEDDDSRQRFTEAICTAADDPQCQVRVIFTLRDDFLGRIAEGTVARDTLSHVTVLRSPEAAALEEILVKPVEAAGYRYEDPELVQQITTAVKGEAACLPLLQFATQMLWERRDTGERLLRRDAYEAMGGVSGALALHADTVLSGLSEGEVSVARELFLRLVTPESTKRILPRVQLLEGLPAEAGEVLGRLVSARAILVRKARSDSGDEPELELVHDSLISCWGQLARWIEESREELSFLHEITLAAQLWDQRGRREEEVWTGWALHEAKDVLERLTVKVPGDVVQFVDAGLARERRISRRRKGIILAGIAVLAMIAVGAVVAALNISQKERETRRQKGLVELQRAGALLEGARSAVAQGNLFEARAKLRTSLETQDSLLGRALWRRLRGDPLVWKKDLGSIVFDTAFSPDGSLIAAVHDKSIQLFEVETLAIHKTLRGHKDKILAVTFAPDGVYLASSSLDGQVIVWDLKKNGSTVLRGHKAGVWCLAFAPDGKRLATAGRDGTIRLWQAPGGARWKVLKGHARMIRGVAFSPDGRLLASASVDRTVRLWDLAAEDKAQVLTGHQGPVQGVAFSPDGRSLASASDDRTVRLWSLPSGNPRAVLKGHTHVVRRVAFSPDGRSLASASWDRSVRLWDAGSGARLGQITGHGAQVNSLAFSPDGRRLASASWDKSVRLWSLDSFEGKRKDRGHSDSVNEVAFSPDGQIVASASKDRTIRLWSVDSGLELRALRGHTEEIKSVAFAPDGKTLASAGHDNTIRVWAVTNGRIRHVLRGHQGGIHSVAFSPVGSLMASAGRDKYVRVWNSMSGVKVAELAGHRSTILAVAFSPDGKELASASADGAIRLWDVNSGREKSALSGHQKPVRGLSYSPDGKALVSAGEGGSVRLWDTAKGTSRQIWQHQGRIYKIAFNADGRLVGVPGADGVAHLWDVAKGTQVSLRGHQSEVNCIRFSPAGRLAATASDDGTIRVWDVSTNRPFWRTILLLSTPPGLLTHRGWIALGSGKEGIGARTRWRTAIETRTVTARDNPAGGLLCLLSHDGHLELWDVARDRRVLRRPFPKARQMEALPRGCLVLSGDRATFVGRSGSPRELVSGAKAIAYEGGEALVATDRQIWSFDGDGVKKERIKVDYGVTAMLRVRGSLVLGFEDGKLELVVPKPGIGRQPFSFSDTPSSPVVRISKGPGGTLIAGYANGYLGIWDLKRGLLLDHFRLHGPVRHLMMKGSTLHAATELGDHTIVDLAIFSRTYCGLVQEVGKRVPVAWLEGEPVRRPVAAGRGCGPDSTVNTAP